MGAKETCSFEQAAEMLGVSVMRLNFLWLGGYLSKANKSELDTASVVEYERWRRERPRWRKMLRAIATPIFMA